MKTVFLYITVVKSYCPGNTGHYTIHSIWRQTLIEQSAAVLILIQTKYTTITRYLYCLKRKFSHLQNCENRFSLHCPGEKLLPWEHGSLYHRHSIWRQTLNDQSAAVLLLIQTKYTIITRSLYCLKRNFSYLKKCENRFSLHCSGEKLSLRAHGPLYHGH